MAPSEQFDHNLRISNIRLLMSLVGTPDEVARRLNRALRTELTHCERLGCAGAGGHDPTRSMRRLATALNVPVEELMP